jgi:hypothetical protein
MHILLKECKAHEEGSTEDRYQRIQEQSRMLLLSQSSSKNNKSLIQLQATMKQDEITLASRNDMLICKFGCIQLDRVGQSRSREVSQAMRELSRLLLELQKQTASPLPLKEYLKPDKFDQIVAGVKTLGIPSLALKLGYSLNKCILISRGQGLRSKDTVLLQDLDNFEKLMEAE